MKDVLVVFVIIIVFVFGYFAFDHIGHFLDQNYKGVRGQDNTEEKKYVKFTGDQSPEEIAQKVAEARKKYGSSTVIICTPGDKDQKSGDNPDQTDTPA